MLTGDILVNSSTFPGDAHKSYDGENWNPVLKIRQDHIIQSLTYRYPAVKTPTK